MSAPILSLRPMAQPEKILITCVDGIQLAAMLCTPDQPKAAVMLSGGTGFKKEFYLPMASFLAEHGFATIVYDYRGTCESAPKDMRNCRYSFLDYGQKDMPAVLDYLDARFPELPKLILGHSVGGQQIGFMPNVHKVRGLVCVCTSVGYLPYMPWSYRLKSYYFFYLFTPISILLKGYVAAKSFKIMEDLPRKVVTEWRAWCARPDYFFDAKYYGKTVPKGYFDQLPFPIHIFWTSDDPIANKRAVSQFWNNVKSMAGMSFRRLDPAAWNTPQIGHHGLFRSQFKDTLWQEVLWSLQAFVNF